MSCAPALRARRRSSPAGWRLRREGQDAWARGGGWIFHTEWSSTAATRHGDLKTSPCSPWLRVRMAGCGGREGPRPSQCFKSAKRAEVGALQSALELWYNTCRSDAEPGRKERTITWQNQSKKRQSSLERRRVSLRCECCIPNRFLQSGLRQSGATMSFCARSASTARFERQLLVLK